MDININLTAAEVDEAITDYISKRDVSFKDKASNIVFEGGVATVTYSGDAVVVEEKVEQPPKRTRRSKAQIELDNQKAAKEKEDAEKAALNIGNQIAPKPDAKPAPKEAEEVVEDSPLPDVSPDVPEEIADPDPEEDELNAATNTPVADTASLFGN